MNGLYNQIYLLIPKKKYAQKKEDDPVPAPANFYEHRLGQGGCCHTVADD